VKRISSFLIVAALIAGLVGCVGLEYDLTIASTAGGSVTTPGEGTSAYYEATVVNLTAEAEEGYQFVKWTGDAGTIANVNAASTTITMNNNYSITADFEKIPVTYYTLTMAVTGGGSTSPAVGQHTYAAGTAVPITATPAGGYRFVNWTGNVGTIANVNAASTTITMSDNYSIIANFEEIPPIQYNLTISSTAGGAVTTPGEGTFAYNGSAVVSLVANPLSGYYFVNWTGDVSSVANVNAASTTITMTDNCSITANFDNIPVTYYTLTMAANGSGSTSPSVGQHTYAAGTVVSITASPASCYRFVNWTGDVGTIGNVNTGSTTIRMNGAYSITANFEQEQPVYFPDTNLEAVVRETIGKPTGPICPSDLEKLTGLGPDRRNIADLTGLEYCTNLDYLYLYLNQITDISPLASLTNLTRLGLDGNYWIVDISPLANLSSLVSLSLGVTGISDLSPVANLTNLKYLYLYSNQISDISPLANLTSLTFLSLDDNQISDLSPVANLTSLTSLSLGGNQISDISPLASLSSLVSLVLHRNPISDFSPLASLTKLTTLDLRQNQISDLSPVANLTNLKDIYLWLNQISDISPLANLTKLTTLDLAQNQISDLSPVANLTNLEYLYLYSNQISDISPLANLTSLTFLSLDGNQVSDISPLASLTSLTELYLTYNQISDISPLADLTNLQGLNLDYNQISDISPLVQNEGLGTGDFVSLYGNPLSPDSINTYIPQLQARGATVYY